MDCIKKESEQDVEFSYYNKSKLEREKGLKGLNKGIPMPKDWKRMKNILPNIQAKFFVILSDSGVGKSKLGHFLFMYNPLFQYLNKQIEDVEIYLYTCEMGMLEVIGEFHALCYFMETGKLTDIDQIYSYGENKISEEINTFLNSERIVKVTNELERKVHIVNERISSGFLYKEIQRIARDNGTIKFKEENGKKMFEGYKKHNEKKWIIFIFDNFQKLSRTKDENTLREGIVKVSSYLDMARLLFGFVAVAMQQVNRNNKSFDRYKYEQYFHKEEDLKDSEAPFHDAQVVISQISPFKLGLDEFDDYDVTRMKDRLRAFKVIKNRGGLAYGVNYFRFLGENSHYKEIPYGDEVGDAFYDKIAKLKKE